jgi:hypothetical protein
MTWSPIWPGNFFLHFEVESKPKQNWSQKISKFSSTKQNFNPTTQFQSNKLTSDQTRFYTRLDFSKYVTCRLMFQPNTNINKIYIIIINREHSLKSQLQPGHVYGLLFLAAFAPLEQIWSIGIFCSGTPWTNPKHWNLHTYLPKNMYATSYILIDCGSSEKPIRFRVPACAVRKCYDINSGLSKTPV